MGEESGYIRFDDPDAAIKARAAAVLTDEGGFILKNHITTLEPLSGMHTVTHFIFVLFYVQSQFFCKQ